MQRSTFTHRASDGESIFVRRWTPAGTARASILVTHGMGEHSDRYDRFASELVAAGFVVFAHDHRGHGHTAGDPASFGDLGPGGWDALVDDLRSLGAVIDAETGLPRAIFAHSMGSFALQQMLLDDSGTITAAVLSGTSAVDVLAGAIDPDATTDLTVFNAAIDHPRTGYDWLSRDEAEVDKYVADPMCAFVVNAAGLTSMAERAPRLADPDALRGIRGDLPILLISGSADPLSGDMALVELVATRYREAGVRDVEVFGYPGARHELLNETNRDEVTADVVAWLEKVLAPAA